MIKKERTDILNSYPDIILFDELVEILNIGVNTAYDLLKDKKIY